MITDPNLKEKEITKGIESRSKYLSRIYPFLDYNDLVQDGYLLMLEIAERKPNADLLYLMKALNNMYANKSKEASDYAKNTVPLSALEEVALEVPDPIDRIKPEEKIVKAYNTHKSNKRPRNTAEIELLEEHGIKRRRDLNSLLGRRRKRAV